MKQRVNPKRVPRTQADVDKAWHEGAEFGAEFCLNLILLVLKDKHDAQDEDIIQLRDEFMEAVNGYNAGYFSYADVRKTLDGDYGVIVHLKG